MGGLADALAMQGRRGDSTLVHMNPMEVRMLETMSPDGRLSINPETGLPEAFKLKDILSVALPIAGGALLGPAIAPGLIGTAIGTGIGGLGAGLAQGKNFKESLVQGGISGLMSYGLGSLSGAFAPSGGVTAGPPTQATMAASGPGLMSTAPDTVGAVTTAAAPEPTGFFGGLGETLRQTPFTDVPSVGSPTYGSMLGSGASGLLSSALLAPEEMPYDVADMYDMDAYYASRVPDLRSGRLRGQAAARSLNYPPSGSTSSQYYSMATSPSGFGTFYAADGGRVPTDLNINGEPHQLSYINQDEADLLRSMGGSGQNVYGIPAYYDASNDGGDAAGPAGGGVGASNDGGDAAGPAGVAGDVAADTAAEAAAIGEAAAYGDIGSQAVGMGFGGSEGMGSMSQAAQTNTAIANTVLDVLSPVPTFALRGIASMLGRGATALGIPGTTETASAAVASQEASQDGSGGDSGVSVYGRPYGDPYNTEKVQASPAPAPSPVSPTALRSLSPTAPRTAGDIYNAATTGGIPRFFTTMAQGGGISSLAYGGEAAPVGFANKAFEGMVPGQGTGMSDDVPFSIEGNQPALLSRDEYVLPADVVSQLGDGSSSAGADMLDNFISQVRQTKYGNTQQPAPVGPQLMTGLMRQGGVV